MPKGSGLGDNIYIDQYDMSGDAGSAGPIASPLAVQEVPGIKRYAQERIGLKRDGAVTVATWFNPDATANAEGQHAILKTLPTTDRQVTYANAGQGIGCAAASLITKQVNYDGTRGQDGSFSFSVNAQANGFGLEWGNLLTAGLRTDTTATSPATGVDLAATPTSLSFGWVAYLHVMAFTGTSVTVTLQDSADNSAFTSLTGGAFTAATTRGVQRLVSGSSTATVRRYVRAITTGTFSNAVFVVNFVRFEQVQT